MRNRLGIYFHVPFCKQACTYCDFHFSTQINLIQDMADAQTLELVHYSNAAHPFQIETIYFGGGTPSILEVRYIQKWLDIIHHHYSVSENCEITLEINPDDIESHKVQNWKAMGINRFSVGIQSFDGEVLQWMNRAHSSIQSKTGVQQLQDAGFENISVDLIYGHGKLDREEWFEDVNQFIALGVPHISAYALTVEAKTPLEYQLKKGYYSGQDEEQTVQEFMHLHQILQENGYHHYEVSNYAKPGFESKHNRSYWEGHPYLGIGPSAHSFNGKDRRYNVANNPQYIRLVQSQQWDKLVQWDRIDDKAVWNELWLIGLRTKKGVDLRQAQINPLYQKTTDEAVTKWIKSGHLIIEGNQLSCTPLGWMVLDLILLDFFVVE
jgi:oxygen-independent coproporphyrinogen III oxidase